MTDTRTDPELTPELTQRPECTDRTDCIDSPDSTDRQTVKKTKARDSASTVLPFVLSTSLRVFSLKVFARRRETGIESVNAY